MAIFLVMFRRAGPQWDRGLPLEEQSEFAAHAAYVDALVDAGVIILGGPLADEHRVVHVVEAESADRVRLTYADDPWSGSHLVLDSVEAWTIRLDGRRG
jgi:uncharacterized protein YciI